VALVEKVQQAPWRGDENIDAGPESLHLGVLIHAAENDGRG
jgi:hypothetical protein